VKLVATDMCDPKGKPVEIGHQDRIAQSWRSRPVAARLVAGIAFGSRSEVAGPDLPGLDDVIVVDDVEESGPPSKT
jgi:hypothetical protein